MSSSRHSCHLPFFFPCRCPSSLPVLSSVSPTTRHHSSLPPSPCPSSRHSSFSQPLAVSLTSHLRHDSLPAFTRRRRIPDMYLSRTCPSANTSTSARISRRRRPNPCCLFPSLPPLSAHLCPPEWFFSRATTCFSRGCLSPYVFTFSCHVFKLLHPVLTIKHL